MHAGSNDLLAELQFELWIGDAAEIRTKRVRKQKTDRQDAQLILQLLLEDRFPQIWVPSWENRDLRQLLWHRHRMVQARTRIMNQLQAVALNEGLRCKKRLWRERGRQQLESFRLAPWASRRRRDLLELLDRLNPTIAELTQAIEQEAEKCPAGAAIEDSSRSGCTDRAGVRADHRRGGSVSLRQAGGQLSGTGAVGRLQRQSATAGTYHQAGQFDDCASCWWKRRRSQCAACRNGAVSTFTWRCGGDGRSPRSPWRGDWPFACTGCGARDGITSR